MAARVQETEVAGLVETKKDLIPFIETANLIVDEDLANSGLSESRKKQVELYLAAHFAALSEEGGGLTYEKLGDAAITRADHFGQGLLQTRYGQMAVSLDTSGTLAASAESNKRALFRVV